MVHTLFMTELVLRGLFALFLFLQTSLFLVHVCSIFYVNELYIHR